MLQIRKARQVVRPARLMLSGASGHGKTWTAIEAAVACREANEMFGFGNNILVLDTEHESSSLYADANDGFDFHVAPFHPPFSLDEAIKYLRWLRDTGIKEHELGVLVFDSMSHVYSGEGGALAEVNTVADAKFRGNTWSAWSVVTPKINLFIELLVGLPIHVIATMRAKTNWVSAEGKRSPKKVGESVVWRDGIDYEFDVAIRMAQIEDGVAAVVDKTRYSPWSGKTVANPTRAWFKEYLAWLASGVSAPKYVYADGEVAGSDAAKRIFIQYTNENGGSVPESAEALRAWYSANGTGVKTVEAG